MNDIPDTRYVQTGDGTWIAYQVFGTGAIDVLFVPGWFSNVDEAWNVEGIADVHRRLGEFARVIVMDRRGTGLSDRLAPGAVEPLEAHVGDLLSVVDAVQARRVCELASETASPLGLLFAATHPDRVRSAAFVYPWFTGFDGDSGAGLNSEIVRRMLGGWGTPFARWDLELSAPSVAGDDRFVSAWARYLRASASPSAAAALHKHFKQVDARDALELVSAPVLLLHRPGAIWADETQADVDEALRRLGDARAVALSGRDLPYWIGDRDELATTLREFFTGSVELPAAAEGRRLLTVLFTDLVGSTEHAAVVGDEAWSDLLARHRQLVRTAVERHRGQEVDTAGDGFFATFEGPARAVRTALEAVRNVHDALGIALRAGVHTGEVETGIDGPAGLAVHIGARVGALAAPGEVLVSSTVRDLSAGSGLVYEDAGEHSLKGVPDQWRLFRAVEAA